LRQLEIAKISESRKQHAKQRLRQAFRSGGRTAPPVFRCGKRHVFSTAKCRGRGNRAGFAAVCRSASLGGVHHMVKTLRVAHAHFVIGAGPDDSKQPLSESRCGWSSILISGVKMAVSGKTLRKHRGAYRKGPPSTPMVPLVACLRLDDKSGGAMSISPPVGQPRGDVAHSARSPCRGRLVGQPYQYVDDFDLDGTIDIWEHDHPSKKTVRPGWQGISPVFLSAAAKSRRPISRRLSGPSMTKASRLHSSTWANSDT